MPDHDDRDSAQRPASGSRETRGRNSWFSKAKDFFFNKTKTLTQVNNFYQGIQSTEQAEATEPLQHTNRPPAQDSHGSRVPQISPVQESPMPLQTHKALNSALPSASGNTTEPEATPVYTDEDVLLDSLRAAYSQTSRSRTHIYNLQMLIHTAGYPLYIPTPPEGLPEAHRKHGIRVGDVGVITANGAFDFRFNACKNPSQSDAEITDPVVLPLLEPGEILSSQKFGHNTYLPSDPVNDIRDRDSPPTFQCSSDHDEGAVLVLPKGATVYEARNRESFRIHASRHALTWYKYMLNAGMNISNGSLYFITECTKSVNWGITVFYARPKDNDSLRFIFDGDSYRWDSRGKVEARVGPNSESADMTVSDGGKLNQCVFLRGYKIMLRSDVWNKLNTITSGTSNDGGFSTPNHSPSHQSTSDNHNTPDDRLRADQLAGKQVAFQGGGPSEEAETTIECKTLNNQKLGSQVGEVILEEFFSETAPLHPSDLINAMLLHLKPEAIVALTHDSIWCDHLPDGFITNPIAPNVDDLLESINKSCKAVVDQYGGASLEDSLEMDSEVQLDSSQATKEDHPSHIMPMDPLWNPGSFDMTHWQNFNSQFPEAAQQPLKHSSIFFTGRDAYLQRLREYFSSSIGGQRKSFLLYGLGGIGKTQICLRFIEENVDLFSNIFWIEASSEISIELGLMGIAQEHNAPQEARESAGSVLQWICQRTDWLIIYDGADGHASTVEKFLPPGNGGNILMTSRNVGLKRITLHSLEVMNMEEEEAAFLLLKSAALDGMSDHNYNFARKLASELDGIPLALDQAGAYILTSQCGLSDYLELYLKHKNELLSSSDLRGVSDYERTTYGTWDISMEKIENMAAQDNRVEALVAIRIMRIFAFLDHANIPQELFKSAAENYMKRDFHEEEASNLPLSVKLLDNQTLFLSEEGVWEKSKFLAGIQVLISFSLIEAHDTLYSMHLLVHSWNRNRIPKGEMTNLYHKARALLSCSVVLDSDIDNYAFCRLLAPHIRSNTLYGSELKSKHTYYDDEYERFTLVFHHVGSWDEMEALLLVTAHWRMSVLGANNPKTLACMANLASTYRNQGRWDEAEKLEVDVINTRETVLGQDHPDTLSRVANLASTYRNQGKWEEAERLEVDVMNARKAMLGSDHPDTLTSMANLASTYRNQGRWDEAEKLEVDVINVIESKFGSDHPDTLTSMANLASTYWSQGRWDEAERLEVDVMKARKTRLGPNHPDTLTSMDNLASTYWSQGRWNEAEQLFVDVINAGKTKLGSDHPYTLTSMANLASTYWSQRKWDDAEKLHVDVLNARKAKLGEDHPDTLTSMANLASTYWCQGRLDEAHTLLSHVVKTMQHVMGPQHPTVHHYVQELSRFSKAKQHQENQEIVLLPPDPQSQLGVVQPKHKSGTLAGLQGLWKKCKH